MQQIFFRIFAICIAEHSMAYKKIISIALWIQICTTKHIDFYLFKNIKIP